MNVRFEELSAPKRAGGIEAATQQLCSHLTTVGVSVQRGEADTAVADPDVVHMHGLWSPSLVKRALVWKRRGKACLISTHGMLEPWALQHKRLKKALAWRLYQKWMLQRADALHATATKEPIQFRKLGLTAPAVVIPWGVPVPEETAAAPTPKRSRTALFVGRIYPVKGLPMLVDAWARVKPTGWKMRIVGPDEAGHRAEVEALVQRQGLANDFEFAGELKGPSKDRAYAEADLFVLPSHTENFGMAVGEALAHGLPVLTTRGAPWQQLETHRCGWWVDVNAEALARGLVAATGLSPEDRAAMGERGRRLIEERYSWPKMAAEFKNLYAWLAGRGDRPESVEVQKIGVENWTQA